MSTIRFSAPITKTEQLPDGRLLVEGIATSEAIDSQDERLLFGGSVQAMAKWFESGPAIREAHDPKKPVGRGLEFYPDETTRSVTVRAFVSKGAQDTQEKVKDGTLAMFSVGGEPKTWTMEKIGKKRIRNISEWEMHELSLVDRGANPDCHIELVKNDAVTATVEGDTMAKADKKKPDAEEKTPAPPAADDKKPADKPAPAEGEEAPTEKDDVAAAEKPAEAPVEQKKYASQKEAEDGVKADVEACNKEAEGMALALDKKRAAIAATAAAFGLDKVVPKEWAAKKEKAKKADGEPTMAKSEAAWDIRAALDCLAGLEALRATEQMEAAAGMVEPPEQVGLLDAAIAALKAFVVSEAGELAEPAAAPVEAAAEPKWTKALAEATAPLAKIETRLTETQTRIESIEKAASDLKALPGEVKAIREEIEKIKAMPVPGGPRARWSPEMVKAAVPANTNDRVRLVEEMLATASADAMPFLRVELERAKAAQKAAGA